MTKHCKKLKKELRELRKEYKEMRADPESVTDPVKYKKMQDAYWRIGRLSWDLSVEEAKIRTALYGDMI